ncbi:hypothetical protein [Actinoplanes sp. NPDC020271]|uniref:hypothetical protein n=1 Tax=Actinoplanes sp. NPDC020271 TaxID=3363896 RepID=UPI0037883AE0
MPSTHLRRTVVALATALLIGACGNSSTSDDNDVTPAVTSTSSSSCPPPGEDCGGARPSGAGGGSGSDDDTPFIPRGTGLNGAGTVGAPGDVLPTAAPSDVVAPAGFLPGE